LLRAINGFQGVGIVGVGVVGSAVRAYFESQGVRTHLYDPGKRLGSSAAVSEADLIFVCVPTPYVEGSGFDDGAVYEALAGLQGSKTVVIKSTVVPGSTERYQAAFRQHQLLFNAEFLRERSANEDFLHPDRQIVGYCAENRLLAQRVLEILPRAPYEAVVPARSAELIKYATNSFLAVKVVFANELFDLCSAVGIEYETVKEGLTADERIGDSHFDVMDSGYRGYGGKCLPKDTMALLDLADEVGSPLRLLLAAHEVNQTLRLADSLQRVREVKANRAARKERPGRGDVARVA
jgi:UDPglucose 6-dehydrogenase